VRATQTWEGGRQTETVTARGRLDSGTDQFIGPRMLSSKCRHFQSINKAFVIWLAAAAARQSGPLTPSQKIQTHHPSRYTNRCCCSCSLAMVYSCTFS